MGNDNTSNKITDKQIKTDKPWLFKPGESGNPAGRPKRKTLTELIHAKLDDTPGAWESVVKVAIQKALTDKDVLKTLWQYTDGMPKQGIEMTGKGGEAIEIKFVDEVFKGSDE